MVNFTSKIFKSTFFIFFIFQKIEISLLTNSQNNCSKSVIQTKYIKIRKYKICINFDISTQVFNLLWKITFHLMNQVLGHMFTTDMDGNFLPLGLLYLFIYYHCIEGPCILIMQFLKLLLRHFHIQYYNKHFIIELQYALFLLKNDT